MRMTMPGYAVLFFLLFQWVSCTGGNGGLDLSMYDYRDTKKLVRFVHDAAVLLESDENALDSLRSDRDRYDKDDYYLYVYDTSGVNVFHAGMEFLEGRHLGDVVDVKGRNIFQLILEAVADSCNPHSWVHYSWWEPGNIFPVPKSSCHFLVTTPGGRNLVLGGGMNYPLEEREFVRIAVDGAAAEFEKEGKPALGHIGDPCSRFNFRDVRVFAAGPDGAVAISPLMADDLLQMNLLDVVDFTGTKYFALALEKLSSGDAVWQVFLARTRFSRQPVKMGLYLKRAVSGDDTLFFGAVTNLPMPP